VWQSERTSEEIQEGGKKGQSRRELSERLDVGRSEMFGDSCHSGGCRTVGDSRGLIMNESSRSKGVKNVLSLQVARELTRQAKAASDRQISERSNQRLLERLEAENAQLRDLVVELMLEIQALHDGAK